MSDGWAIGLMTGTVLDGNIDIAMLRTDGERIFEFGPYELVAYPAGIVPLLREAMQAAIQWRFVGSEPEIFARAERALTTAQSEAVNAFLSRHGFEAKQISAIGFHGQTVLHVAPQNGVKGQTRQLGDGALMADITGITTVHDFRSADIKAGGQGAPLAPVYHRALLEQIGAGADTAILNLGGVANISWCRGSEMAAFDTGPANAPVNDWVREHTGGEMDRDGAIAAQGQVDEALLETLLAHPYMTQRYPKSLDRNDFTSSMAGNLSLEDGAATLTAFSAAAVGKALDLLPQRPTRLILCGGGRKNPYLKRAIADRAQVEACVAEDVGLRGDAIEAECFAYLAMRSLRDLPLSYPATTGVSAPICGGKIEARA
ncbi:anhydro-N-acetylmuramic acid kinase [Nitratireductor basaltis]|uniref:Anhydro-N-acetylmuramic acid kinase n=1 Tax=Nitratireductor basaltis TaxID=472175 RepID=A0A084UBZ8_9HYPH|nr:anhydro-N-acetylmuramic acid kinase [Nitratireductor basaltis]KFB10484.1 Anhydro-N-acetylmuramic acid kinase [Nitratireductor basaltis]